MCDYNKNGPTKPVPESTPKPTTKGGSRPLKPMSTPKEPAKSSKPTKSESTLKATTKGHSSKVTKVTKLGDATKNTNATKFMPPSNQPTAKSGGTQPR